MVITDFPAEGVLENIQQMVQENAPMSTLPLLCKATVRPHVWGTDPSPLLRAGCPEGVEQEMFDILILAELLW